MIFDVTAGTLKEHTRGSTDGVKVKVPGSIAVKINILSSSSACSPKGEESCSRFDLKREGC